MAVSLVYQDSGEQKLLDRVKLAAVRRIDGAYMRENFEVVLQRAIEHMADDMSVMARTEVLAEKAEDRTVKLELEVPADWLSHMRQDWPNTWFGRWLRRKWPVKTRKAVKEYVFEQHVYYPEANILPRDFGAPYINRSIREIY